MDIVVCFDKGFVMPTGVMMYSLCVNNICEGEEITFHAIIDDSVTNKDKQDICRNLDVFSEHIKIHFYYVKDICTGMPTTANRQGLTKATYYRLFMADILPKSIEKVLYLDGDMIVRHSLLPIWNTDITSYAIAAVSDAPLIEYENRLKIPSGAGYFNAGVLLINLNYWREHNVTQMFNEYVDNNDIVYTYHDQDLLNSVLWDKKVKLPIKYNFISGFLLKSLRSDFMTEEVLEAQKDPVIVHFGNIYKPWELYVRNPHPFSSTFYKYQNMTMWKDVKIDVRPLSLKIKNFASDYLRKMKIMKPLDPSYIHVDPID